MVGVCCINELRLCNMRERLLGLYFVNKLRLGMVVGRNIFVQEKLNCSCCYVRVSRTDY